MSVPVFLRSGNAHNGKADFRGGDVCLTGVFQHQLLAASGRNLQQRLSGQQGKPESPVRDDPPRTGVPFSIRQTFRGWASAFSTAAGASVCTL